MRFSSITLIAATVAAIAGGTIAAPTHPSHPPPHPRLLAIQASHAAMHETKITADTFLDHPKHGASVPWLEHHHEQSELNKSLLRGDHHDDYAGKTAKSWDVASKAVNARLRLQEKLDPSPHIFLRPPNKS